MIRSPSVDEHDAKISSDDDQSRQCLLIGATAYKRTILMNLHTATLASGFDRQTCETINLFAARLSQKYHIIMFGYHGLTENSLAHLFWRWTKYMSTANRSAHDLSSPELAFSKAAYLTTLFTSSGICHLARTQTLIPILFPSGTTQKSDQCLGIHLSTVCLSPESRSNTRLA